MKDRARHSLPYIVATACGVVAVLDVSPLAAQTAKPDAGAKKPSAAATTPGSGSTARSRVIAGIKSYEAGKMPDAISKLTGALGGGGLSSKDMAKALYYRGLAYRRQSKPARAIADLNSAVWLRGGLSEKERADALSNRAEAYKEAGLRDPGYVPGGAAPSKTPSAVAGGGGASATQAPSSPAPERSVKPNVAGTPPASNDSWQTATNPGSAATGAVPASPAPSTSGGSTSSNSPVASITNFFSGVFGGGSSSSANSTSSGTQAAPSTPAPPPASAVSAWNSNTSVSGGGGAQPQAKPVAQAAPAEANTKVARAPAPAAAAAPAPAVKSASPPPAAKTQREPTAPKGKFSVQVASKRSAAEANQVVSQLAVEHSAQLGGRMPYVKEAVIGSMGTFYQVRVGPFANKTEAIRSCKPLRAKGYDCLTVTN